ncbi:MAG: hotdog domain-containing protein [Campylobacterota bacterium]
MDESVELQSNEEKGLKTHLRINNGLCGQLIKIEKNEAQVELVTSEEMSVDSHHLVHGGFTFGAADFCAMAAVNDPNVVLVNSNCKFLSPVKVGDKIRFKAKQLHEESRKREINVTGYVNDVKVLEGKFMAVVLEKHVLSLKLAKNTDDIEKMNREPVGVPASGGSEAQKKK